MKRFIEIFRYLSVSEKIMLSHEAGVLRANVFQDRVCLLKIKWKVTQYYLQVGQENVFGHYLESPTQNSSPK